jgi:hypothetical protein
LERGEERRGKRNEDIIRDKIGCRGRYSFPGNEGRNEYSPSNPTPGPSPNELRIWRGEKKEGGREMKTLSGTRPAAGDKYSFPGNEGRNEYSRWKRNVAGQPACGNCNC